MECNFYLGHLLINSLLSVVSACLTVNFKGLIDGMWQLYTVFVRHSPILALYLSNDALLVMEGSMYPPKECGFIINLVSHGIVCNL